MNAAGDIISTLSARVSELTKRVAMLQAELESATKRLAVYEEHDASIQDALSTALKNAYQIRERAEVAAGQLLEQAREERRMLLSEITRLREERDQVQEEIAAQRRSSIAAVSSRPLSSDNAAAELRAVASEALKGLFQEIVDEIRTTERATRVEPRREERREEARREEPRREEPAREEPVREERRAEPRRPMPHIADIPHADAPPMTEAPTYEAMKRIRRARVTEDEDLAPQRADFVETAQAVDALLSFETAMQAPVAEAAAAEPAAVAETEPVTEPEPVAPPESIAVAEPEPIVEAEPEPIAETEAAPQEEAIAEAAAALEPETVIEPIEEVEQFEAPAAAPPEPVAPEPVMEAAPEPRIEAAPTPVAPPPPAPEPARPMTYQPPADWRTEAPPARPPAPTRPAPSLPTSFAEETRAPTQPEPQRAAASAPASFATEEAVDPRLQALSPTPMTPIAPARPPLEVVRAPAEIRETHHPRVEAASPTSDIQLVLSPVPSFPRLVEIERRIQSLPVVRTLYVRDFRAGAATLAVALRSAMTPEEFASILASLQQPRLRLVAGSRNTLELRIEGEAGVA